MYNNTNNETEGTFAPTQDDGVRAGYLERCNPGVGYAHAKHPPCDDSLVCVTDNHYASWCITCDTDSDVFALQCMLVHPNARENTAAACKNEGCNGSKYAGRDERCKPPQASEKDNQYFKDFKACAPGLQCATTKDKYTQCVVCQDPFWSEDCVFWKPDFLGAAKEICGATKCESKNNRAKRDERCSPTPEHETFGGLPQCEVGLRCATTRFYSQCVSCDEADYLQDCPFWEDDMTKAAKLACQGAPKCVKDGTTTNEEKPLAKPDERCKTGPDDMLFAEYPECDSTGVCASTGHFTQCVDCSNWEYDCYFWQPMFLEAAEEACGYQGKGCVPNASCGNGAIPDGNGNCVVDNGEKCVPDDKATTDENGVVDPTCRNDLECIVGPTATQCVDCAENFLYDCVYWEAGFLAIAEETCERKCTPLTEKPKTCQKDSDCGKKKHGWVCVSTCNYSQCVQCFGKQFDWDCGYWQGSFLAAAEMRCGKECNPKECPHDRTASPTLNYPTRWPSAWPTQWPTEWPTTSVPTKKPSLGENSHPTAWPTTAWPTAWPSNDTDTGYPTSMPTSAPTNSTTSKPSWSPTSAPTNSTTSTPSWSPTSVPTNVPTLAPSTAPSSLPTSVPSTPPTAIPTSAPTKTATNAPVGDTDV
jgi:hypothetical protein